MQRMAVCLTLPAVARLRQWARAQAVEQQAPRFVKELDQSDVLKQGEVGNRACVGRVNSIWFVG